jgi:hypothetical protein
MILVFAGMQDMIEIGCCKMSIISADALGHFLPVAFLKL